MSLKNWRESAEIISVSKCCASFILSAVFPMAVGPTIEMRYFAVVLIRFLFFGLSKIDKSAEF